MKDFNTVQLTGTVVKDFGYSVAKNGTKVATWIMAINNGKTKEGQEKKADFFRCRMFGQDIIDKLVQHVGKGTQLLVSGTLKTRSYEYEDHKFYEVYVLVKEWKVFKNYKKDKEETQQDETAIEQVIPEEMQYEDFGHIGIEDVLDTLEV